MKGTGYVTSVLDGTELDLDRVFNKKSMPLPDSYNYSKLLPPLKTAKNQGSTSMCVAYSLSYILEGLEFMSNPDNIFSLDKDEIYSIRQDKEKDGMQPKEALEYIKKTGYKCGNEIHRILNYGKLRNFLSIKKSLLVNGPCMFAVPCYDECKSLEFWKGSIFCGGHAICCVGYNEKGFILENSWGKSWGKDGKVLFPYEDCNRILEAWAIIK